MTIASVIIVNWNTRKLLKPCLNSVRRQTQTDFEVILVDNGSTDDSVAFVKQNYAEVKIIENKTNVGLDEAINIGAKKAKGRYIVFINTDMIADKNWLKELVEPMEKNPELTGVSSMAYNGYWKKDYEFQGFGTTCFFGQCIIDKRIPKKTQKLFEVFGISGGAGIIRNEKKQIFDPDYFMYSEDAYYTWLKKVQGALFAVNPKSYVYHEEGGSSKKVPLRTVFYQERNRLLSAFIGYEVSTLVKLTPLLALNLLAINLFDIKHLFARVVAYSWLLWHFSLIARKRKFIQKKRKVSDKEIIKSMSCKFYEELLLKNSLLKAVVKLLNGLQYYYCWAVGLRTTEFRKKEELFIENRRI